MIDLSVLPKPANSLQKYARTVFDNGKRNRAICPHHQIVRWERVKVSVSCTLARDRFIRVRAYGGKGGLYSKGRQAPRRRGRASNENIPRRSRRKHERVSGRKNSPGGLGESWFHSKSGQTQNVKGDWKTKSSLIR